MLKCLFVFHHKEKTLAHHGILAWDAIKMGFRHVV